MRHVMLVTLGLGLCLAPPAFAANVGLPTRTFVQSWSPLPTGHFVATGNRPVFELKVAEAKAVPEPTLAPLLDEAFASARNASERRDIGFSEMMAPWDQQQRTAFQHLRDAEAAYATSDDARHERFAATLARLVGGTGRSAAVDGPPQLELDKAYAAALARAPGDARVATQAEQERWRTYGDAFAAFAEAQAPGSAAAVAAELERQRLHDLAAEVH